MQVSDITAWTEPSGPGGSGCDAGNRIPTGKFPLYSTTLEGRIPEGETEIELVFEAERDTLATDLTVELYSGPGVRAEGAFSVTYCNTELSADTDTRDFRACCQRKPIWLLGVRESKRLKFRVRAYAAPVPGESHLVLITLSGFQGNGCCA